MSRRGKGRWLLAFLLFSAAFIQAEAQWKKASGAMGASFFLSNGATMYAAQVGEGVLQSTDDGASWHKIDSGLTDLDIYALAAYGPNLVAGTFGDGIFVSSNGGASWSAIVDTLILDPDVLSLTLIGPVVYAGTFFGYVFTTDLSDTALQSVPLSFLGEPVYTLLDVDTTLYASTYAGVLVSNPASAIWQQRDSSFAPVVYCLDTCLGFLFAGTAGQGVFRSPDGGVSWDAADSGLADLNINALVSVSGNLFAGTNEGVFLTSNGGVSWSAVNTGLTTSIIYSMGASATTLFVGTNVFGIWARPLSDMIVLSVHPPGAPEAGRFSLEQNYPNPFNPTTTIRYSLPHRAGVTLSVYNILGQQIARLVNENEEAGEHQVRFDATGIASGVYFYRLQSGPLSLTKKLVVIH